MSPSARPEARAGRPPGRAWLTRREVFGLALAAGSTLTGCTPSDPRVDPPAGRPTAHRSPSPVPTAAPPPALQGELELSRLATALASGPLRGALGPERRTLVLAVAEIHRQHAVALQSPQPISRPVSPTPAPPPAPSGSPATSSTAREQLAEAVDVLVRRERRQAKALRRSALSATGYPALLDASMSVAAGANAVALASGDPVPARTTPGARSAPAELTDVEAVSALVRQLHAVVYGYQLALGHLTPTSAAGRRATESLAGARTLTQRLEGMLVGRGAPVPAAAPAYVPSVDPRTPGRAARLARSMEVALLPFCGLWLAAAGDADDRAMALETMSATADSARSWGAPLVVWPGWPEP